MRRIFLVLPLVLAGCGLFRSPDWTPAVEALAVNDAETNAAFDAWVRRINRDEALSVDQREQAIGAMNAARSGILERSALVQSLLAEDAGLDYAARLKELVDLYKKLRGEAPGQ